MEQIGRGGRACALALVLVATLALSCGDSGDDDGATDATPTPAPTATPTGVLGGPEEPTPSPTVTFAALTFLTTELDTIDYWPRWSVARRHPHRLLRRRAGHDQCAWHRRLPGAAAALTAGC